jgi:hypothetical protein
MISFLYRPRSPSTSASTSRPPQDGTHLPSTLRPPRSPPPDPLTGWRSPTINVVAAPAPLPGWRSLTFNGSNPPHPARSHSSISQIRPIQLDLGDGRGPDGGEGDSGGVPLGVAPQSPPYPSPRHRLWPPPRHHPRSPPHGGLHHLIGNEKPNPQSLSSYYLMFLLFPFGLMSLALLPA